MMKPEIKKFMKIIKDYNYPDNEKEFIATQLVYQAYLKTIKKKGEYFGTSSRLDSFNKDLLEAVNCLEYSYFSKKDFRDLYFSISKAFKSNILINTELYILIINLLELKGSDTLLHVNSPDESFLIECRKHVAHDSIKTIQLVIPDNEYAGDLVKMRLAFNNIAFNSICDVETATKFKPKKIFIEPKYGSLDSNYKSSARDNNIWDDIVKLSEGMQPGTKIVALVPNSCLSNCLDKKKKEQLLRKKYIEAIISLPLRYYSPSLNTEVSLLVLSPNNNMVKVLDVSSIFSLKETKNIDLGSMTNYILESFTDENVYTEVAPKDFICNSSNLLISNIITPELYKDIACKKQLSNLADISKGTKKTRTDFDDYLDQVGESNYCLLSSSDIYNGEIDYTKLTKIIYRPEFESLFINNGDLVITNKSSKIKICVIENSDKRIIPLGSMIIISPHKGVLSSMYLKMFFETETGKLILSKLRHGQRTATIYPDEIARIFVPFIDYDSQIKIVNKYKYKTKKILEKQLEISSLKVEINEILKEIE